GDDCRLLEVVEAGHGQVLRDANASGACCTQDADCEVVVEGEDRGRRLFQVEERRGGDETAVGEEVGAYLQLRIGQPPGRHQRRVIAVQALLRGEPALGARDRGD